MLAVVMRSPLGLGLAAVVATLAYLWLTVAALGGLGAFFSAPALVAAGGVALMLAVALGFTRCNLSPGVAEDRGNRWVVWAFAAIGVLLGCLPAWADRYEIWPIGGEALRWLGVGLFALGGVLRIWPVFVLGERFSALVAIQPGHRLVTTGLYGRIRHPSYLGMLIGATGWSLAFGSGVGLLLVLLLVPPLVARIRAEEALLAAQFGAAYEAYRARTDRLVPGLY
jgi:protein-S-isoprenylcysteine O-methyltransferase Ste14